MSAGEDRAIAALARYANGLGDVEHASLPTPQLGDNDEAQRLAYEHGFSDDRLIALRGLAAARGVALERVLRAALAGELRSVVELPERRQSGLRW